MHEDVSFIYKVECAAVERLNEVSLGDKYFPYPVLHIILFLFEINSKARQPAW